MQSQKIKQLDLQNEEICVTTKTVYSFYAHLHSYYELLLYQPFKGQVTVNNRAIVMNSLTAVLIVPGDLHKIKVQPGQTAQLIKLEVNRSAFLGQREPKSSCLLQNLKENSITALAFEQALAAKGDPDYLKLLILLICNRLQALGCRITPAQELPGFALASRAAAMLQQDFSAPLSLVGVAEALRVSPQYLSLTFKKNVGVGFSVYLNRLRLQYAAAKLSGTNTPITAICYDCGYQNLSHFLRSFKKQYGVTPRQYRRGTAPLQNKKN